MTLSPVDKEMLAPDLGPVEPSQLLTWVLDPGLAAPGLPVFLALVPTNASGVELRGRDTTPGAPYLELVIQ